MRDVQWYLGLNEARSMRSSSEKAALRLRHVSSHIRGEFTEKMRNLAAHNLLTGAGSEIGSLSILEARARGEAIYAWFADKDIEWSKEWFATAAQLNVKRLSLLEPSEWRGATGTFGVLDVVCTDELSIRNEIGSVIETLHPGADRDPLAFLSQQIGLLLQGKPDAASDAAAKFLHPYGETSRDSFFAPDIGVFRAIHFGSDLEIEEALKNVCEISHVAKREELENGFTEGLMSTPAAIYLRLCWAIGRRIRVDHELIPMEWMPVADLKPGYFRFPELSAYMGI
jgi:hypothetical protein